MKNLIDHYVREKTIFSPLPAGLADKMARIERAFSHLGTSATGSEIVAAARAAWPTASDGTLRRYLVQFRAVLRMAEADGLIAKAPRIPLPYVHDIVEVDIDTAGVTSMLRWIRFNEPAWYVLATILCHTGARLGEASRLVAADFLPHGIRISKLTDRRSKTIARVVPYTARTREIRAALKGAECWAATETGELRLWPRGIAPQSLSTCLGRVIDQAVVELGLSPLRVHDLRHCMAIMLAEVGADLSDISAILGHSSVQMSARYRGLVPTRASSLMTAMT